jgi:hypothetical protein
MRRLSFKIWSLCRSREIRVQSISTFVRNKKKQKKRPERKKIRLKEFVKKSSERKGRMKGAKIWV